MNGIIYARYSLDNQTENSIEGQLRECKAFAENKGIIIRGIKTKTGGDQLNYKSIRNMIQNRKYLGEYR